MTSQNTPQRRLSGLSCSSPNEAQVPTARGGAMWHPSTVRAAFQSGI